MLRIPFQTYKEQGHIMKLFDYDGPLITLIRKLWSILIAGILFLICLIPVFTAGASFTALYDVTERNLKNSRGYVFGGFLESLKENWRQTLPVGAVVAGVFILFEADVYILKSLLANGNPAGNLYVLIRVFQVLLILYSVWVYAQISRFRNALKQILKNALLLAVRHLGTTAGVFLLLAFGGIVIYILPISALVMPVLVTWFITALMERVFSLYDGDSKNEETAT